MATSGTYTFDLNGAEIAIEVLERVKIKPSEITRDHVKSLYRSCNLIQSRWANRGVNLWEVNTVPNVIPLVQGQAQYAIPSNTVQIADAWLRTYPMNGAVSVTPALATVNGSNVVTINLANHGLSVGNWLNVVIPIAIGGLIVYGFYQAASVLSGNAFTITASSQATATSSGGVVPTITTVTNSSLATVTLPTNGYVAGQPFTWQTTTQVGGVTVNGTYNISTIIDASNFTIPLPNPASFNQTIQENNGQAQIATQQVSANPTDRILTAFSRDDYAATPNKLSQGQPTVFYYDRQAKTPNAFLWNVPDANGPYAFVYYNVKQMQDMNINYDSNADIPFRFLEAYCADAAAHLSMKYAQDMSVALAGYAQSVWEEASGEDRERVSLYIQPDVGSYYL